MARDIVREIEALHRRLERARELAKLHRNGQRVFAKISGLERTWVCKSPDSGKLYLIQDEKCSCPSPKPCKHLLALALVLEQEHKQRNRTK